MKKIPATAKVHQAPDVATDATESESKRKQVSKREYLGKDGAVVDRMEDATGARYTLLGVTGGNRDFDEQFGEAGHFTTMNAILGFHTKAGNEVNTVLNDKDEPGTPDDAAAALEAWIAKAKSGTWATRESSGGGTRVDKQALAWAAFTVAGGEGKSKKSYDEILQKLEEEPTFVRQLRSVPAVAKAYAERTGKATKSVDELLNF